MSSDQRRFGRQKGVVRLAARAVGDLARSQPVELVPGNLGRRAGAVPNEQPATRAVIEHRVEVHLERAAGVDVALLPERDHCRILRVGSLLDCAVLDDRDPAVWEIDAVAGRAVLVLDARVRDGRAFSAALDLMTHDCVVEVAVVDLQARYVVHI